MPAMVLRWLRRLRCRLTGCVMDEFAHGRPPACGRCGAEVYWDWIDRGLIGHARRLACRLVGCHDGPGVCRRCDAFNMSTAFVEAGWLWPLVELWQRARGNSRPRCRQCNKPLGWRGRVERHWCSAECYDAWIPF